MSSPEAVRGLQERAARAQPAEHAEEADGWWLRHAPGCSWWVGTVLPHSDARPGALARRVARAEEFYTSRGAAARFQISPGACPAGLDTVLAGWAGAHGAGRMYLQLERGNIAALRLYARAGFSEVCAYHYRIAG